MDKTGVGTLFAECSVWKPDLTLLRWLLGPSPTFQSLGRVVYSSQLKTNTQRNCQSVQRVQAVIQPAANAGSRDSMWDH